VRAFRMPYHDIDPWRFTVTRRRWYWVATAALSVTVARPEVAGPLLALQILVVLGAWAFVVWFAHQRRARRRAIVRLVRALSQGLDRVRQGHD